MNKTNFITAFNKAYKSVRLIRYRDHIQVFSPPFCRDNTWFSVGYSTLHEARRTRAYIVIRLILKHIINSTETLEAAWDVEALYNKSQDALYSRNLEYTPDPDNFSFNDLNEEDIKDITRAACAKVFERYAV